MNCQPYQELTENELKALELLRKVDSRTLLGHCIHEWIGRGTPGAVKEAIRQIKSQAMDSMQRMEECIGTETFKAVMEC